MEMQAFLCSQCGATEFEKEDDDKLRCSYCMSLFLIENSNDDSGVTIEKGANVHFEPTANVTIYGKLEIEDGANVTLDGNIKLIEKGPDEEIEKSKLRLKKDKSE